MSNSSPCAESQDAELLQCSICSSTLQDAVLLKCLHSICRSCTCKATPNIACPVCGVATDTSTSKTNLIVTALAQRSQVMKSIFSCSHCSSDSEHGASSVAWCYTCQQSLCTDCDKYHNRFNSKHNVRQINEHTVLSELYRPPSRLCTEHGEELTLACFTCQDGRCFKCAHDCYTSSHNVQLIGSPASVDQIKVRIMDADRVISDLNSTKLLLQDHFNLPQKVASAMEENRAVLRNAKKTAIDSISKAYDKAEQSLVECCEILASKAELCRESAESLKKRLDWAIKYCQVALHTEDMTALLPQLDTLSTCLCSLLEDARLKKPPVDPLKLVSMNVCLPRDLDLIACDWIGEATLVSDNFDLPENDNLNVRKSEYYVRRVSALSELEELLRKQKEQHDKHEHDRMAVQQLELQLKLKEEQLVTTQNEVKKLLDEQKAQQQHLEEERKTMELLKSELKSKTEQLATAPKPLSFDSKPRGTFKGPGNCWDVAVTPQGRLLVAAMADGLKEYDVTSFREIATWKPDADLLGQDKSVLVRTMDVLSDGRVLVGLNPKLVVLLQRGGGSSSAAADAWRVERRVAELQAHPRHLSAWDDRLLAVLEDRYDESEKSWCCGPGLVLLSLSGGYKQLHRQQLDYNACSVALTDRGVIVSSSDQVELTDAVGSGGGNRKCYVVDCYSHLGVKLWRHELDGGHKVMSVCSDSVGRVLYAAKCRGPVVALRVDDGRELSTAITLSTTDTGTSYAIRLERALQRRLALISTAAGDDKPNIISIFSVL